MSPYCLSCYCIVSAVLDNFGYIFNFKWHVNITLFFLNRTDNSLYFSDVFVNINVCATYFCHGKSSQGSQLSLVTFFLILLLFLMSSWEMNCWCVATYQLSSLPYINFDIKEYKILLRAVDCQWNIGGM